ncbi:MAG: hypothetical protein CVT74_13795 [Alphaproteobacteria bacterium HGW-Alphaproteobacteria-13]|nr:MAG: hypothetical protein CVT74_13795 [Alphaproteobacteria bacterium HGW-Alphaproteobacteria-13]
MKRRSSRHPGLDPGSRSATSASGTPDQVRGDEGVLHFPPGPPKGPHFAAGRKPAAQEQIR